MADPTQSSETLIGFMDAGEPTPLDSVTPAASRIAGRYEIIGLLGIGGMGSVYKVRDLELDEVVALKMLKGNLVEVPGMVARFRQEVKLARRVTHPNVVRTFDLGEHREKRFLTMEFIDGCPLSQLLATEGKLSPRRARTIAVGICAGLSAAHTAGVLHRDLKPDNVLIGDDGKIALTDFGIARAAAELAVGHAGGIVGTPAYMAPEQVEPGARIDARSDLYALGAVLFEMVTGHRAWPGNEAFSVALARLSAPPPDPRAHAPDLPDELVHIIGRCLARDPEARFASAAALAEALASGSVSGPTGLAAAVRRPVTPARAPSVAVLLFGADPEDGHLAEGFTEELIDGLSMTPGLRVRPLSAVLQLGPQPDPAEVGRVLNVQVVVQGSIRRAGDDLRISCRLINIEDGYQLWAKRYRTTPAEALDISDEAAEALAAALTVKLEGAHAARQSSNPEAIELYLRGKQELRATWQSGVDGAMALLGRARQLAPRHPRILAAFARGRARQGFMAASGEGEAILVDARRCADEAVAIGPEIGETWMALAEARLYNKDSPGAARACRAALERSPGLSRAHEMLGMILHEAGRLDEARQALEIACTIDPTAVAPRYELGRLEAHLGDFSGIDATLAAPVHDASQHFTRLMYGARMALWRHQIPDLDVDGFGARFPDAQWAVMWVKVIEQVVRRAPISAPMRQLGVQAVEGVTGRQLWVRLQSSAEIHAYLGEIDEAMRRVRRAVEDGLADITWMDRCPLLGDVRRDPGWAGLRQIVADRAAEVR